jgi:tetratricopeptide (TPR) repeat protein
MRSWILAAGVLGVGCASSPRVGTATTTSAESASMADVDRASSAIRGGDYERALVAANAAARELPASAWARYDQGVALKHLGRTDAAVQAFREAEQRFTADPGGRAIAIYGRARALADVGRCVEARAAYREYASFVAPTDRAGADAARAYAEGCREGQSAPPDLTVSAMSGAIVASDPKKALELASRAPPASIANPWFHYDRAVALADLGRTDDAVRAYEEAERRFPAESTGRRDAVYGRARALDAAGRCDEAAAAYASYAGIVRPSSPTDAEAALAMSRACKWR